ncbi:NUDIX hydrolase [Candidatus Woesearchaeota archaeon]|nr:NUDIX hydrolase [Candidatus Woesearchaeota archaeon]
MIEKKVRATVGAVIENDGKVLLVKRNCEPFKGFWSLPDGHIDFGETAEQAVIREVKEETGLTIKRPMFLGYRDELYPDINWHGEVLVFHGKAEGRKNIDGDEIIDIGWFDLKEASGMNLAFDHQETLKIYQNKIKNAKKV